MLTLTHIVLTLLTQLVAIVMQSNIIIAALKIVPVFMFLVCHYVHRDANTFSLNNIFNIMVANCLTNSVAWCVECKRLLYHFSGVRVSVGFFFLRVSLGALVINA